MELSWLRGLLLCFAAAQIHLRVFGGASELMHQILTSLAQMLCEDGNPRRIITIEDTTADKT